MPATARCLVIALSLLPQSAWAANALDVAAQVRRVIELSYVDEIEPDRLEKATIPQMIALLDVHSAHISATDYRRLQGIAAGTLCGPGFDIDRQKGALVVRSPDEGGAAMQSGVRSGDEVVAVDGVRTHGLSLVDVWLRLNGKAHSRTRVRFRKDGAETEHSLVRDCRRAPAVEARMLAERIGYLRVRTFLEGTNARAGEALQALRRPGEAPLAGLVIDLRDNPGGLLDEAVDLADRFLTDGLIATTVGRGGRRPEPRRATRAGTEPSYPMAVLVDAGTASAAEMFAAAIQENGRGRLVGRNTYGKGTVQSFFDLDDGSALKLTVARYLTPTSRSIHGVGVSPDVLVAAPGDDADLAAAVEALLPSSAAVP